MRKGLCRELGGAVAGLGAALVVATTAVADASACPRRAGDCGYGYGPPPVAYRYAPPPPPYGYGPPPEARYARPPEPGYYDAAIEPPAPYAYGYRAAAEACNDDRRAPPAAYDRYRPAGPWVPAR